jgi:hypothetical protein
VIQSPYDAVSGKRMGPNRRKVSYSEGGKVVLTVHSTVSRDGKTMTVNLKGTDAQGKPEDGLAVYDRQLVPDRRPRSSFRGSLLLPELRLPLLLRHGVRLRAEALILRCFFGFESAETASPTSTPTRTMREPCKWILAGSLSTGSHPA